MSVQWSNYSLATHITAVIDEASHIASLSGINDVLQVHTKQVTGSNSHGLIPTFPLVCSQLPDHLSHILNYHLICRDLLHCKQAPVVNGGLGKFELLLASLERKSSIGISIAHMLARH